MAVVSFDISDFEREGISLDELNNIIPEIGMEVESISENEIRIDITPNRPDMLDFFGLVRAIKLKAVKEFPKKYSIKNPQLKEIYIDAKRRPYISALVVKNIDLSGNKLKYLINFTEKLGITYGRKRQKLAIGIHDFDEISGNLKYKDSQEGVIVPLIEFKAKTFKEILESHPNSKKFPEVVKAKKITFLSDAEKVIALIPIINSNKTKVTEDTKNLFVDITGTEKSVVNSIANLLACSFADQNCELFPCLLHYAKKEEISPSLNYKKIKIKGKNTRKSIGFEINDREIIASLNTMGYIAVVEGKGIAVSVPPYRTDVLNEQDVIEDVAIGYGYANINPKPIFSASNRVGAEDTVTKVVDNLSINMVGFGFSEAINNYLTNKQANFDNLLLTRPTDANVVSIAYSKTETLSMLRTSILPSLLQNLSASAHEPMPQRLFEVGGIFGVNENKAFEDLTLGFVSEHSKANFIEIKGYVERILQLLGYEYIFKESKNPSFIEGRYAEIIVDGEKIGEFGELHPQVLLNFKLEEPVAAAELRILKNVDY
ncbi:phenylalanine--tRNA ligase subunit beta [Candidatus Marsarchaeota archaeon]|jgi:phenylalanyl-tRNA synthetase beta chain|nr:phenylalanine--tRNA ligase subunit beta [Candidatus Marsarchaeota archaeon]MCL5090218.1 phenylalanine--tRNA ligase subunit beta [Candidatus Marsarchaeota archaeon]